MTEAEWLVCSDPRLLLAHVFGAVSDRKTQLAACAFYRMIWDLLDGAQARTIVEDAEVAADLAVPMAKPVEHPHADELWYNPIMAPDPVHNYVLYASRM